MLTRSKRKRMEEKKTLSLLEDILIFGLDYYIFQFLTRKDARKLSCTCMDLDTLISPIKMNNIFNRGRRALYKKIKLAQVKKWLSPQTRPEFFEHQKNKLCNIKHLSPIYIDEIALMTDKLHGVEKSKVYVRPEWPLLNSRNVWYPPNIQDLHWVWFSAFKHEQCSFVLPSMCLPPKLKKLVFSVSGPLELNFELSPGTLPEGLERLQFNCEYNKVFSTGVFPDSLKSLSIKRSYDHEIDKEFVWPSALEHLYIWFYPFQLRVGLFPNHLKELEIEELIDEPFLPGVFPSSLEHIEFKSDIPHASMRSDFFNQPIEVGVFLSGLCVLSLPFSFNQLLYPGVLPPTLNSLTFGEQYNQEIGRNVLPASLRVLKFGDAFNTELLPQVLNNGLEDIYFGKKYNQAIQPGVFPSSVKSIYFDDDFNQPIEVGVFPPKLLILTFGSKFNQSLYTNVLPSSIEELSFLGESEFDSYIWEWPKSLKSLWISYSYYHGDKIGFCDEFKNSLRDNIKVVFSC